MADAREYQVKQCYAWENALRTEFKIEPLRSIAQLDQVLEQVWDNEKDHFKRKHKRSRPTFSSSGSSRNAKYSPERNIIVLPKWARSKIVMLHELAHYFEADWDNNAAHGSHWLGALLYLLGKYATDELPLTESALVDRARTAGLRVVSPFEPSQELGSEFVMPFPPTPQKGAGNLASFNQTEVEHIKYLQRITGWTGRKEVWEDVGLVWQINANNIRKVGYQDGVLKYHYKVPRYQEECSKSIDWLLCIEGKSPLPLKTEIKSPAGWKISLDI